MSSSISLRLSISRKGGYEQYVSPKSPASRRIISGARAEQLFFLDRCRSRRHCLQQREGRSLPRAGLKDILDPAGRARSYLCVRSAGCCSGLHCATFYGDGFWKEFAKLQPRARSMQVFDRLCDDMITAIGECLLYMSSRARAPRLNSSHRHGWWRHHSSLARSTRPHIRKRPNYSLTGRNEKRGQPGIRRNPNLCTVGMRTERSANADWPSKASRDFKLLYPSDWDEYASRIRRS